MDRDRGRQRDVGLLYLSVRIERSASIFSFIPWSDGFNQQRYLNTSNIYIYYNIHYGTFDFSLIYYVFHILPKIYTAKHATFPMPMYAITV